MTTPTNEEVRRQFEAVMREMWGSFIATRYDHGYAHDPENCAWQGYQAALRSPAVVALVEKLRAAANYVDVLGGDSKNYRAALAPFTTGAGHE